MYKIAEFFSNNLEQINTLSQMLLVLIALFALVYAIREYGISKKRYEEDNRPYVYINLERITSGLFDLVITNTGLSAAKNIQVIFKPNIAIYSHTTTKINSFKFLKNYKFLAPAKSFAFYFGSVIGGNTKICREFEITLNYQDWQGKKYTEQLVIDPRDYLNGVSIDRKNIHDVAKNLETITKELKSISKHSDSTVNVLERGVSRADSAYSILEYETLERLLRNLLTDGAVGIYNTFSIERDAKTIAKFARDKLLSKSSLSKRDKNMVQILNKFESSDYRFNSEDIIKEFLESDRL